MYRISMPFEFVDTHPQDAIDAASPGETIVADPTVNHTLDQSLTIDTPRVTLRGVTLGLDDEADENLIEIGADGVRLTDFTLDGNRTNQTGERQSSGVLVTGASNITIARGFIKNVSRHGLRIVDASDITSLAPGDTIHVERGSVSDVTVRDVRVDAPRRDGCSVEGPDLQNISVENVRTFDSSDRGSVEIKDGASDAYVANCYAENCVYGVAVQDHGNYPTNNVQIVGNTAKECQTLIDAQTSHPPESVTILGNTGRGLGGDGMGGPGGIHLHLIEGLVVANNVLDGVDGPGISVDNCTDAMITENVIRGTQGPGVDLDDSDRITIGQNGIDGHGKWAIACHGSDDGTTELQVTGNRCTGSLVLDGTISRYLVTGNLLDGRATNEANGSGRLANNLY